MKIIINNEVCDINLWSYLKLHATTQLLLLGIAYGFIYIVSLLI